MKRFRLDATYAELKAEALAQRDFFDRPAAWPDGDGALDCLCTD